MTFTGDRFIKVPSSADVSTSVDYFRKYMSGVLLTHRAEQMQERLLTRPLRADLTELLSEHRRENYRILDVGAGPATTLGLEIGGACLKIVAIDACSAAYNTMLDEIGIAPPVRTSFGLAETLDLQFGPDSFDLVFSENALDHTNDPVEALQQMVHVVKPGRYVYCEVYWNEGEGAGYDDFHNWNFDVHDGEVFIWNKDRRAWNITDFLPNGTLIEHWFKDNGRGLRKVLAIRLKKHETVTPLGGGGVAV